VSIVCLATVTSDAFVAGTLVTIYSFLRHNRWFDGDIVVIHDELSDESREYLLACHGRIRFRPATQMLLDRIDAVTEARPDFVPKRARFLSLEAFGLAGYDKVMFCDSDLLFRQPVRELFTGDRALVACGDGAYYRGVGRNFMDSGAPGSTFNAGLFVIGRTLLAGDDYASLLQLVSPRTFLNRRVNLTDQVILNSHLNGLQSLVSGTYNYLLVHRSHIHEREGIGMADAHVLHFNGEYKPWIAADVLRATRRDPAFVKPCGLWYQEYVECIQSLCLHRAWASSSASVSN
jgi:lipopolysaccharide biosynthesis glycosyltransferase